MNHQASSHNGNGHTTTYWFQPIQAVQQNNIVMPEIEPNRVPEYLKMNSTDSLKLLSLLGDWKMSYLFRTLFDALVDIEALKYITPAQCDLLLMNFPLGIRIKFVGKVMNWRQLSLNEMINNTLLPPFNSVFM